MSDREILKEALLQFADKKLAALTLQQKEMGDAQREHGQLVRQLARTQTAQLVAMKSLLWCMLQTHPNPSAVLERFLGEMDGLSDSQPDLVNEMQEPYAHWVKLLTDLTKPRPAN